jgi:hypothetical protein
MWRPGRIGRDVPLSFMEIGAILAADPPAEVVLLASFGPLARAQVRIRLAPLAAGSLVHMEERPVSGPSARFVPRACSTWSSRPATPIRRLRRLAEVQQRPQG